VTLTSEPVPAALNATVTGAWPSPASFSAKDSRKQALLIDIRAKMSAIGANLTCQHQAHRVYSPVAT